MGDGKPQSHPGDRTVMLVAMLAQLAALTVT
jgi:hypothetical protein